jgi:hypothetical protein
VVVLKVNYPTKDIHIVKKTPILQKSFLPFLFVQLTYLHATRLDVLPTHLFVARVNPNKTSAAVV